MLCAFASKGEVSDGFYMCSKKHHSSRAYWSSETE